MRFKYWCRSAMNMQLCRQKDAVETTRKVRDIHHQVHGTKKVRGSLISCTVAISFILGMKEFRTTSFIGIEKECFSSHDD